MLTVARRPAGSPHRRAVLACLPHEHHSLGLIAFGVVLHDLGWSITFLGRDTPMPAVRKAADAVGADAIVLAAVMQEPLAAAEPDLAELMGTHPVVVGGPAAARDGCGLPRPRLLRPNLVGAAHALTLATPDARLGHGADRAAARRRQRGSLSARA